MLLAERLLRVPWIQRSNQLRTFVTAAWLGWQIESNWADPLLFAVYSFARPVASVLILVIMYSVITNGATQEPIFAYIYLGNALYILVGQVISGVSWTVISDREQYRVIRQLYTTPMDGYFYLMGRGVARLLIGLVSLTITVTFGVLFFRLPLHLSSVNWPILILSMALGIVTLATLGLIMGSFTMMMARHNGSIGDAIAGGLYLFSGAIFPLDVLPAALQPIGYLLPVTYWLEVSRRALLGPNAPSFPTFAAFSDAMLLVVLAVFTVILVVSSVAIHRWCLHRAKENGVFDMETAY